MQKTILEKIISKITLTPCNDLEISLQPICKDAVTSSGGNYMESLVNSVLNEDTILDSEINGGVDGKRVKTLILKGFSRLIITNHYILGVKIERAGVKPEAFGGNFM